MGRIEDALKRAASGEADARFTETFRERLRPAAVTVPARPEDYLEERKLPAVATAAVSPTVPSRLAAASTPRPAHANLSIAEKMVVNPSTNRGSIEQYRRVAATLHQAQREHGIKIIMVSSALPREGKTLTSTNLALTLSHSYGRRVLLVDADLRRPSVHQVLQVPSSPGLGDVLRNDGMEVPLVEVTSCLTVLPAGPVDGNPIALLTSGRMRDVLADAATRFDWVIVDTPPVGLLSDAKLMAEFAHAVVLVIAAGRTDYRDVERAIAEIGRERIIGAVLNRVEESAANSGGYYDDYYYSDAANDKALA